MASQPPFTGLRVFEYGIDPSIAYAGKLFADLGATVVKFEPPEGDPQRRHGPFPSDEPDPERSGWFLYLNANKRSVALDTSIAGDRDLMLRALRDANVLFHASRDPELESWGIAPDQLARTLPHLVVASVTPFGWNSSFRGSAADDLTLQALGGESLGLGMPGRPPLKLPLDQSSYQAGLSAAIAACGALLGGGGGFIDVSAADVWATFYMGPEVANAHFGRRKRGRAGHHVLGQPYPHTVLPCKDGFFAVQCSTRRHWQAFLEMVGRPELAEDPLFANRVRTNDLHSEEADALFAPWFGERTKDEILRQFLRFKIPGAPVYSIQEAAEHPHLEGRRYFTEVDYAGGSVCMPTTPYQAPGFKPESLRPAPRLGEYNEALRREVGR